MEKYEALARPWKLSLSMACDILGADGHPVASTSYPHTAFPRDQRVRMQMAEFLVKMENEYDLLNEVARLAESLTCCTKDEDAVFLRTQLCKAIFKLELGRKSHKQFHTPPHMHAYVKNKNTTESDRLEFIPHIVVMDDGTETEVMARDPLDAINVVKQNRKY